MKKIKLPLIPLRDLVIFPHMVMHFDCGRKISVNAIERSEMQDSKIFLVAQRELEVEDPKRDDLFEVGTVATIKQILKLPGGVVRVLVEGEERAKISDLDITAEIIEAEIEILEEDEIDYTEDDKVEAALRLALNDLENYASLDEKFFPGLLSNIADTDDPSRFIDTVVGYLNFKLEEYQTLLETTDIYDRLVAFHEIMKKEIEILSIEKNINDQVKKKMDDIQREYYLKEQLRVIHKELGDGEDEGELTEVYKKKIEEKKLPDEVKEKALSELKKLRNLNSQSPDYSILINYLDWILDLPWMEGGGEKVKLSDARKVLNDEHYGLENVKERILEFIAVRILSGDKSRGPILCLVGPPGVGKTSIAQSIAKSLDKEFVRMSLGGITDEAEIRGHRRTYIGALPGRIISLMKKAGKNDPVFLFDEIDKIGNDFKGDPASALLEVLDPEQNNTFTDRYMELPFDLSNVFFIATANTTQTIPRPLLDRMELIDIGGYTPNEKLNIAKKYLVSKQISENGLKKENISISEKALKDIIDYYTRESGVRGLEKQISKIVRKAALKIVEENLDKVYVSTRNISDFLGEKIYLINEREKNSEVGSVNGLAWTEVGGTTLVIETTVMPGKGNLTLTGSLGDVMKESAIAAISHIASNAEEFKLDPKFRSEKDIHIHVPEGAVPKDGPSAGITIATSVLSALTKRPVRSDVAMTGEITLRGKVLPIGGLKEKLLAAERFGVNTVIIPSENKRDLKEIEEAAVERLNIKTVSTFKEVAEIAIGDFNEDK
ncbi:endopeptidase La [Peptoniphilus sp.]|uniref:endopeptidase La n=1 Tax=Peptoniphilus sp. TaxID=1971214 RepID=UPI002A82D933|nr:endopeptidase La [Peptoniphilus sp.]MDY3903466.1 endopeptidase La [Peptoniphilus sp.]